jgi:cell division protein FtsB
VGSTCSGLSKEENNLTLRLLEQVETLQKQFGKMKMERDFLKKVVSIFSKSP